MNEFTKEELEGLKNIILHAREDYPVMHSDRELSELLIRIKSMIDNYCEHENCGANYGVSTQCDDCGKVF